MSSRSHSSPSTSGTPAASAGDSSGEAGTPEDSASGVDGSATTPSRDCTSGDLVGPSGQFGTVVAAAFSATAGEDVRSGSTSLSRDSAVLSGTSGPSGASASDSLGECVFVFVTRVYHAKVFPGCWRAAGRQVTCRHSARVSSTPPTYFSFSSLALQEPPL